MRTTIFFDRYIELFLAPIVSNLGSYPNLDCTENLEDICHSIDIDKYLYTDSFPMMLFIWQTTGQQIAVKKCGMNNELTQRLLEKWIDEVEIMSRINHDNIVKALPTPQQLAPKPGEPVPLVMEYCSGGDLRAVCTIFSFTETSVRSAM